MAKKMFREIIKRFGIAGLLLMIGGALLGFAQVRFIQPVQEWLAGCKQTNAVIGSNTLKPGEIISDIAFAQLDYQVDGQNYQNGLSETGRILHYCVGDQLTIYYKIDDPADARPALLIGLYYEASMLILFALPFLIFGLIMIVLGILDRDSIFDLSKRTNSKNLKNAGLFAKLMVSLLIIALGIKMIFDIPALFILSPYIILCFSLAFLATMLNFVLSLLLKAKN